MESALEQHPGEGSDPGLLPKKTVVLIPSDRRQAAGLQTVVLSSGDGWRRRRRRW